MHDIPSRSEDAEGVVTARSAWHAMGDPDADEMLIKTSLIIALDRRIRALGLTQTAAAARLGIPRSNLARLLSGTFRSVTHDQLYKLLGALDVGVHIQLVTEPGAHVEVDSAAVAGPVQKARAVAERAGGTVSARRKRKTAT